MALKSETNHGMLNRRDPKSSAISLVETFPTPCVLGGNPPVTFEMAVLIQS